jgi:hypothetical protein
MWAAAALAVLKLSLLRAQPIYAIGNAIHDDQLFLKLGRFIADGQWLGPYDNLTLAKGPVYSAFVALNYYVGLPLRFTEELVYVGACALAVRALRPLALAGWARLLIFATLLANPFTYEGLQMTRILRQHLTAPFALVVCAALIALVLRRERNFSARLPWALAGGLALGLFWITREEGIWILGMTAFLAALALFPLLTGPAAPRRAALGLLLVASLAGTAPLALVATLNLRHYGWFGTTEFHAADFRDAYGALVRVQVGPRLPYVAVTREAREAIYRVSPAFAELRPHLEGEIGLRWADADHFRREERQIASGWFMWALRDAVAAAGHATSAKDVLAYYRRVADEVNRACDEGKLPALGRRSGFFPPWQADYAHALRTDGAMYLRGVFDFSEFEPNPPYSVGTDDEVRIFRDITHERISPSLRATYIELPEQQQLDRAKLGVLRWLGRNVGAWLATFIVLAHFAALVRLIELVRARRFSWLFACALGAWAGGAAELALNILVHTTSFPNYYPAAYAPSWPLLLFFALLLTADVARDWRAPAGRALAWLRELVSRQPRAAWSCAIGLIVFAARLREVTLHASDAPFLDQWKIEAQQILAPWLRGELGFGAFFQPHHEHVPLWTRLLVWLQAALGGTWDPRLQMTINAALHATWIALLCDWLRRNLPAVAALTATLVALGTACLPHAWENITWGFQSQFPLALLCLFLFVRGSMSEAPGSRAWWVAQAIGFAGLFTLGSFWVGPLLVALTHFLTAPRAPRTWLAPLGLAALGAGMMLLAIRSQPVEGALALHASSIREFLHAWFYQLGWPVAAPAAALVYLPLLAMGLRGRAWLTASAFDRTLLVLGVCGVANAAAIAFARGGSAADFVSRYSDLAAVGVIVNAVLLVRLVAAQRAWLLLAAAWMIVVAGGLRMVNTSGHAAYFHEHSAARAAFRENAITAYVRNHNTKALTSEEGRGLIYPDPAAVTALLDDRRFVQLLPRRVTLAGSAPDLGAVISEQWKFWLTLGLGLAALTIGARFSIPATPTLTLPVSSPWPAAAFGVLAFGSLLFWPRPFAWDSTERWESLLLPRNAQTDLRYEFASPTNFPNERLEGASGLAPEALRNIFFGTHLDGPGFVGDVRSSPFVIQSSWLVVPIAGFPTAPGNSLALVVENPDFKILATLHCETAVPRDVTFWSIDVRAFRGRVARLVLHDGRNGDQGWLAVAPPQPTEDATAAARLNDAWDAERTSPARASLVAFGAIGVFSAFFSLMRARRRT